jgi:hypothetical protein
MATLIVQDDEGDVANANSYVTLAYFQNYHTNRGNDYSDSSDDEIKGALVRSTDYLDQRFDFRGVRLNAGIKAAGTLLATDVFTDGETVVIGDVTYTFRDAPSVAYDVKVGLTFALSLSNLAAAVMASGTPGTEYAAGTEANEDAEAVATTTTLIVVAAEVGSDGNDIVTTTTAADATWSAATLEDGADSSQETEWPRKAGTDQNLAMTQTIDTAGFFLTPVTIALEDDVTSFLVDPNGKDIVGIPAALKRACAEYAFRALSIPLFQDAPAPEGGRLLDEELVKVDVIESLKRYSSPQSGSFVMPAYPAADLLLVRAGLIQSGRSLIR